jgi:predicted enzyme related to lactoylglutathione lyase
LVVADLEASARFYADVFGLNETGRVRAEIAGRGIDEIMLNATAAGGAMLVLLRFDDQSAPSSDEVILGFISPDVDALVARATAAGGAVAQVPAAQPEHGVKVGFVTDNEGHLIEVVELLRPAS